VNRYDLHRLAAARLADAKVLFRHDRFGGCYYLAGYAVECGLKACIAKKTRRYDFPDKNSVLDAYTHDLSKLLRVTGLEETLKIAWALDPDLRLNRYKVIEWSEQSRYEMYDRHFAERMLRAVADSRHGVLRWLRQHW
jgi:HEPN domain-containing protein